MLTVAFIAYKRSAFELTVDKGTDESVYLFTLRYDAATDSLTKEGTPLSLGSPARFEIEPGVYFVSTVNTFRYVLTDFCEARLKSGKKPWPTPPPPRPKPFEGVSDQVWATYCNVVGPGGGSDWVDILIEPVFLPRDREIPPTVKVS